MTSSFLSSKKVRLLLIQKTDIMPCYHFYSYLPHGKIPLRVRSYPAAITGGSCRSLAGYGSPITRMQSVTCPVRCAARKAIFHRFSLGSSQQSFRFGHIEPSLESFRPCTLFVIAFFFLILCSSLFPVAYLLNNCYSYDKQLPELNILVFYSTEKKK